MSGEALLLVLSASAIHAGWNLLAKRSGKRLIFLWLGLAAGLIIWSPVAFWIMLLDPPPWRGFLFILASGSVHFCYYQAVARMYAYDFSVTYPTARGISPVFTTILALALLREPLTFGGIVGIAVVVAGVGTLQLAGAKTCWRALIAEGAFRTAATTGALIAAYSVIDKVGVALVHPISYLWLSHLVALVLLAPVMWNHRQGILPEIRDAGIRLGVVGLGQNLAYILVLFAMRMVPVAYVVPTRELSTVFAVLLGSRILGESHIKQRLAGAFLIVAGIGLIAWQG